eukprot:gnl/TRDRNA2_/TRDRNA2_81080_c0_seq1.p1 gnl/TRDRNA2_/TRDRNA2_81080_c0~~gnl/TRDRNA2_/TRDRNA2_81080_c0_seq1.p1  ORF type:complete len:294 (-),score=70.92 gnl/TRDRNA2_/TRDRNA2_81080_c0_seq1:733-1614(-)
MQMTFTDSMKPVQFEKPAARKRQLNFSKACVGIALTSSIFCVDSLLNGNDALANYFYYFAELAAVVLLLVAGSLWSTTRGKDHVANAQQTSCAAADEASESSEQDDASTDIPESSEQDDASTDIPESSEQDDASESSEQEDEVDLQSLMDAAQNAVETELEKQFEETLRRMDAECQSGIDAALSSMKEVHSPVLELEDLSDVVGEAFPDMDHLIEEIQDPLEARLAALQDRVDEVTRRRSNLKMQCGTVCTVFALILAGSCIDCVSIEPYIVEACVLPVSMVCGYLFFSVKGR